MSIMESRHVIFGCVLLLYIACGPSWAQIPARPTVRAEKSLLSYLDRNVRFDCLTSAKIDNKTIVLFHMNGRQVFNSSGKLEPGVTKINATAMTTTNIANGITDAYCQVNSSVSGVIKLIPYVTTVTFSVNPNKFKVGQLFNATCGVQVLPTQSTNFNVTFTKDSAKIAQWTITGRTAKWMIPPTVAGIEVSQGGAQPKNFSARVNPKTSKASGKYGCSVLISVGVSPTVYTYNSWQWNTNSGASVLPSLLFVALCTLLTMLGCGKLSIF